MTAQWLLGACVMAIFFGATVDIEQGDYRKATALIFVCALWPVSIALGVGFTLAGLWARLVKFVRRMVSVTIRDEGIDG